jgi:hypothetical protein
MSVTAQSSALLSTDFLRCAKGGLVATSFMIRDMADAAYHACTDRLSATGLKALT